MSPGSIDHTQLTGICGRRQEQRVTVACLVTFAAIGVGGCSAFGLGGTTYPPASAIQPLPRGDTVIFDVTFPPEGFDNMGDRVVAIGLPKGVTAATGWSYVVRMLETKGWRGTEGKPALTGLCGRDGDPCAEMMGAPELESYSSDAQAGQIDRLLAELRRFPGPTVLVWFGYV